MKARLGKISEIKSGYTLRCSLSKYPKGSVEVIQAINVASDDFSVLTKIHVDNIADHALRDGDVLLGSKGSFKAKLMPKIGHPKIATSSLLILRPDQKELLPAYLEAFLNSDAGQSLLGKVSTGAYIKSLSRSELQKMIIPLPSLEVQKSLVGLIQNIREQRKDHEAIIKKLEDIFNSSINQISKEFIR